MQLYSTALLLAIGRAPTHSLMWVWLRFLLLCTAALTVGIGTTNALAGFSAYPVPSAERFIPSALLLFHGTAILLSIGSATAIQKDTFARLLHVLPLTAWQRTAAWLMPSFCLCLLGIVLIMPVALSIFGSMGLASPYVFLASIVGLAAGLGLVHGLAHPWRIPAIIGACSFEYLAVRLLHNTSSTMMTALAIALSGSLLAGSIALLWKCHTVLLQRKPDVSTGITSRLRVPARYWLWGKLVRNHTMQFSLLTGLLLSTALALYAHHEALPSALLLPATAILGASMVCDLRGSMRRHNPPEICALKGTWYFHRYCLAVYALSSLAVAPLLWLILSTGQSGVLFIIGTLLLGYTAGTLASTVIAAPNRNIATQFATIALTNVLFLVLPASLGEYPARATQGAVLLGLACTLWAIAYGIEYQRNRYIWRT